ncbi:uncharacterized protein LOC110838322 isoform X2 [Zootermopsis nevadensis]|nr:uncharacterized protein LOC110838322 isoform X2 [Zootermopsis nevadensis]
MISGSRFAPYVSPYAQVGRRTAPSASKLRTQIFMKDYKNRLNHMETEFLIKKKQFFSMKIQFLIKQKKLIKLHTSLVELHDQIMKLGGTDLEVGDIKIVAFSHTQHNKKTDEVNPNPGVSTVKGHNLLGNQDINLTGEPQSITEELKSKQDKDRDLEEGLENAHELSESEQNLSARKLEIAQLPSQVEVPEGQLTNEKNSNHLKGEEEVTELKEENEKSELSQFHNALNDEKEKHCRNNFVADNSGLLQQTQVRELQQQAQKDVPTEVDETRDLSSVGKERKRLWTDVFRIRKWKIWRRKNNVS